MWTKKQVETWTDPYAVELKRRERRSDRCAAAMAIAAALLFVLWISHTDAWLICEMWQHLGGCYELHDPCFDPTHSLQGLADPSGGFMCL